MLQVGRSRVWFRMRSLNFFNLPNPSSGIMTLGSTQSPTEMSTRKSPWEYMAAGQCVSLKTSPPSVSPLSTQCLLEVSNPYGIPWPVTGTPVTFYYRMDIADVSERPASITLTFCDDGGSRIIRSFGNDIQVCTARVPSRQQQSSAPVLLKTWIALRIMNLQRTDICAHAKCCTFQGDAAGALLMGLYWSPDPHLKPADVCSLTSLDWHRNVRLQTDLKESLPTALTELNGVKTSRPVNSWRRRKWIRSRADGRFGGTYWPHLQSWTVCGLPAASLKQ
jgi:hypothetical protein